MSKAVKETRLLLSGDEALARGAYEYGLKVACAYPGTPSTEILEALAHFREVDTQWSVNEKVAFEVSLGAAIGGVRSLYASKHVGLNVAMDPLMTSAYTGINAGFVAVVCDDPGLQSSQNEQDTRWVSLYGKLPMIEPASPSEAYAFVKSAFEVSEQFDTPVLLRMTTRVAHSKEDVAAGARVEVPAKDFSVNAQKYVMVPKNAYARHLLLEERLLNLQAFSEKTPLNRVELNSRKLGFITSGVTDLYAREAFPDASFLKLGFVHPFCDRKIAAFAAKVKELVVIEELDPFIEQHVRSLGIRFKAKHPSYRVGELRPEYMQDLVAGRKKTDVPMEVRKPVLCPGCGHRFAFSALKREKAVVSGDIGCYTLAASPPMAALHTCVCMGAGVTIHEGLRRARPNDRIVGVVGDSTFIHSGITGLINAVYNRMKGVIMILDNGTTAMTGAQNHPATGKTIRDEPTRSLSLENLCRSCGVEHVDVIDPKETKALRELIRKRLDGDTLSVIIARRPCWQTDRVRHNAPVVFPEKCRKCYLCLNFGCPALVKLEDGVVTINNSYCVGCQLCAETCPFGALVPYAQEKESEKNKQEDQPEA